MRIIKIEDTDIEMLENALEATAPWNLFFYTFTHLETGEVRKVLAPCSYGAFARCPEWKTGVHVNCPKKFYVKHHDEWKMFVNKAVTEN